jgi:hypothetical protein
MTVANQTNRIDVRGTGNVGQVIPFSFPITDTSDLTVLYRSRSDGVETSLTETSDYTVEITDDIGGEVTMVTAVTSSYNIMVVRNTPFTQSLNLEQGGSFNAENVEDGLDKSVKLSIEHKDLLERALICPEGDPDTVNGNMTLPNNKERASAYLYFDASGYPTAVNPLTTGTASISPYMEATVLVVASEAALHAAINLEIGTDVQAYDAQLADIAALAVTDGNIIVGDGSNWVAESGATARTSLGVHSVDDILCYEGEVLVYEQNVLTYV